MQRELHLDMISKTPSFEKLKWRYIINNNYLENSFAKYVLSHSSTYFIIINAGELKKFRNCTYYYNVKLCVKLSVKTPKEVWVKVSTANKYPDHCYERELSSNDN